MMLILQIANITALLRALWPCFCHACWELWRFWRLSLYIYIYTDAYFLHLPNVFRSYQFPFCPLYGCTDIPCIRCIRCIAYLSVYLCCFALQGLCLDRMVRMGFLFNQLRGGSTSPQSKSLKLSDSTLFNYSLDLFFRRIWRRKCFEHFFQNMFLGLRCCSLQPMVASCAVEIWASFVVARSNRVPCRRVKYRKRCG